MVCVAITPIITGNYIQKNGKNALSTNKIIQPSKATSHRGKHSPETTYYIYHNYCKSLELPGGVNWQLHYIDVSISKVYKINISRGCENRLNQIALNILCYFNRKQKIEIRDLYIYIYIYNACTMYLLFANHFLLECLIFFDATIKVFIYSQCVVIILKMFT